MNKNIENALDVTQLSKIDKGIPVYALGTLRPFFSTLDLQKEFDSVAQSIGCSSEDYFQVFTYENTPKGNEDLKFRPFLYIAAKACWVFSINNVDTYVIVPRYENELDALINTLKPGKNQQKMALIGTLGPISPSHYCNDLKLPIVICSQILSIVENDASSISLKLSDGVSPYHRAINFLSFNYSDIVSPELKVPDPLVSLNYQYYNESSGRILVEVILTFFNDGIEVFYSCGIDVTDMYPFIDFPLRNYLPSKK